MPNLWQWREVDGAGQWLSDSFYTGDINLLKETVENRLVHLILPGQDIVSDRVPAEISDRKQLLKILPYELEEFIIDPVENLQFSYGPIENGSISVAYGSFSTIAEAVQELEDLGAEVQRVVAEYVHLPLIEDGWTLLLENDRVMVRNEVLGGFTVEHTMVTAYLEGLHRIDPPQKVVLYADDQDALYKLNALLPVEIKRESDGVPSVELIEEEAGFWDLVVPAAIPPGDMRTGKLARKLPFAKWWGDFKAPAIAASVAFAVALGSTWLGLSDAEAERRTIMSQTDDIFRQVVPRGNISDPERQLRGLLGGSAGPIGSSNAVALISGIGPALNELDEVKVRSMRYSAENGQLQLNVEAQSFATFETLRGKIAEAGFAVEIKSANVYGDVHQAQLRVSEAG